MTRIKNEIQYNAILLRIEELLKVVTNETPTNDKNFIELDLISDLVADYDEMHLIKSKKQERQHSIWHDGSEQPDSGRIMYESTNGGCCFADYDKECNRFDSDDECYYSGEWEYCHIKRWIYEQDILNL